MKVIGTYILEKLRINKNLHSNDKLYFIVYELHKVIYYTVFHEYKKAIKFLNHNTTKFITGFIIPGEDLRDVVLNFTLDPLEKFNEFCEKQGYEYFKE